MIHRQVKIPQQQSSQVKLPSLSQKPSSPTPNAPTGGFWTQQKLALNQPVRAFNQNLFTASRRVQGSRAPSAMTPDVYSAYWSRV